MFLTLNRRPTVIDHHTGDEPAMKERTLVIFRAGRTGTCLHRRRPSAAKSH
jgi:hypothetical protein